MASSSSTAQKNFNLANNIIELSPQDEIYRFDKEANKKLNQEMPWTKECVTDHLTIFFRLIMPSEAHTISRHAKSLLLR